MKCILLVVVFTMGLGCNDASNRQSDRDSSYPAITDSSAVTKDSLPIPDSSTRSVTH
jgi:hypothetical protein